MVFWQVFQKRCRFGVKKGAVRRNYRPAPETPRSFQGPIAVPSTVPNSSSVLISSPPSFLHFLRPNLFIFSPLLSSPIETPPSVLRRKWRRPWYQPNIRQLWKFGVVLIGPFCRKPTLMKSLKFQFQFRVKSLNFLQICYCSELLNNTRVQIYLLLGVRCDLFEGRG